MDDELGTALVLMHRARRSLTSLECTHWTWTHTARAGAAFEREAARSQGAVLRLSAGEIPAEQEDEERLWLVAPERCRREHEHGTELDTGEEHWHIPRDPAAPAIVQRPTPDERAGRRGRQDPLSQIRAQLDPQLIALACTLEATGGGEVDGRPTIVLAGVPRDDLEEPLSWMLHIGMRGADRIVVGIDRALGLAVRVERHLDGQPFSVEELRDLRVGHHISAARFDPAPELDGREVLSPEELHERMRAAHPDRGTGMPRPHHHEPTGPGPEDEASATAAIQAALDALFGPRGEDLTGVEGGDGLGPILDLARERNAALIRGEFSVRVERARFLHARLAEIECRTVADGPANGQPLSGFAFEQDGRWLISRETLARLLSMGGVSLPPRTVGLHLG